MQRVRAPVRQIVLKPTQVQVKQLQPKLPSASFLSGARSHIFALARRTRRIRARQGFAVDLLAMPE